MDFNNKNNNININNSNNYLSLLESKKRKKNFCSNYKSNISNSFVINNNKNNLSFSNKEEKEKEKEKEKNIYNKNNNNINNNISIKNNLTNNEKIGIDIINNKHLNSIKDNIKFKANINNNDNIKHQNLYENVNNNKNENQNQNGLLIEIDTNEINEIENEDNKNNDNNREIKNSFNSIKNKNRNFRIKNLSELQKINYNNNLIFFTNTIYEKFLDAKYEYFHNLINNLNGDFILKKKYALKMLMRIFKKKTVFLKLKFIYRCIFLNIKY